MPKVPIKFETERTRRFRSEELSEEDVRTISDIERFGCRAVHVADSNSALSGWSYTIGVYDTCGQPEIIQVGLRSATAHALLNSAADELRVGANLSQGRHSGMIANVECEFRPVDPKWVKHLMNWATWYYNGAEFPVLQAIYPDLENRFPWEDGFDNRFQQPMLQPGVIMTSVEDDFWASADPKSSLFNWKFEDGPHTGVYLSKSVHSGDEAVTYVSHDLEDGAWQFLGDSMTESGGVLVCFHHPIDKDSSLTELSDLPLGWYAVREKLGDQWERYEKEAEEEEPKEQSGD